MYQGHGADTGSQRVGLGTGMNDHQLFEVQILQRGAHGRCDARATGQLDLEAAPLVATADEEIELGAAVQLPEEALLGSSAEVVRHFADSKTLPGGSHLRVAQQVLSRFQAQQGMKDTAVRQIDLRGLHMAFGQILVPGLQPFRHEGGAESVQISADGLVRDPEGASQLRAVPDLSMIMSEHSPEPPHRRGGELDSELGEHTLQIGANELLPPEPA